MNAIDKINGFIGADWYIEKIIINGEKLFVELSGESAFKAIIQCNNFIGYSFVGHWDEGVIKRIWVEPRGDLLNNSVQEIKHRHGGDVLSDECVWYQLNIEYIDGSTIKVACENFDFEV